MSFHMRKMVDPSYDYNITVNSNIIIFYITRHTWNTGTPSNPLPLSAALSLKYEVGANIRNQNVIYYT